MHNQINLQRHFEVSGKLNMRPVWKYKAEARRQQQQRNNHDNSSLNAVLRAAREGKLGVCFSGAAFGASYQLGAAQILQELGLLGADTPIAGASAGAIVAVATRCALPQVDVLRAVEEIAADLRQHGEKRRLRGALQAKLQQVLPPDAHVLCSSSWPGTATSAGGCGTTMCFSSSSSSSSSSSRKVQPHYHITPRPNNNSTAAGHPHQQPSAEHVTQQQTSLSAATVTHATGIQGNGSSRAACSTSGQPPCVLGATRVRMCCPACVQPDVFAGGYASNEELLQALLTGAHMPGVSDGTWWTHYRGHRYVDGGMRDSCPPIPGVEHTLIVYPVPNKLFKRPWPYRLFMKPPLQDAITVSPGQYRPWPYVGSYKQSNDIVMHPQAAGVLNMLFERGRRDTLAWAQYLGLTADHVQQLRAWRAKRRSATAAPAAAAAAAAPAGAQGMGAAAAAEGDLGWLQLSPEELPMLVPVPQALLHLL